MDAAIFFHVSSRRIVVCPRRDAWNMPSPRLVSILKKRETSLVLFLKKRKKKDLIMSFWPQFSDFKWRGRYGYFVNKGKIRKLGDSFFTKKIFFIGQIKCKICIISNRFNSTINIIELTMVQIFLKKLLKINWPNLTAPRVAGSKKKLNLEL